MVALLMTFTTSVPTNALVSSDQLAAVNAPEESRRPTAGQKLDVSSGPGVNAEEVARAPKQVTSAQELRANSGWGKAHTIAYNPNGPVQWPFPYWVPISDGYGARHAPTAGASSFHQGADFTPGAGTPIQIISAGIVRSVTSSGSCGVSVVVDHVIDGQHTSSTYCHMQSGSVRVSVGQIVAAADIVGSVGSTGISTGAHLHFEIRINGKQAVDPVAWLRAHVR